ncbi:MAG: sensor histidine kinase [Chloroflexi bacterium]|nr:MAG: sensor histidine kinase [Chloroflexota bacterium]
MASKLNLARIYLILVSVLGILIIVPGIAQFESYESQLVLVLVLVLAGVAEFATYSFQFNQKSGITFSVSIAVSMSVLPFYGPFVAALTTVVSNFSVWLFKPKEGATRRQTLRHLIFNLGMHSISMFIAGGIFISLRQGFGDNLLLANTIPWFLAAIINDQLNFWILMGMLRLQNGPSFTPLSIWKEIRWAIPVNIAVAGIGGGVLAFAIAKYDWVGVAIFFFPIILSAYLFRLYLRKVQSHMNDLENIIKERTRERDAFLAVLTHDMKSPLTSIGLYANLLKEHPEVLQKKPRMVDSILRSHATLTRIVHDIQDLKRMEVGNIALNVELFDLNSLVETVVERLRPFAFQKQITMTFESKAALPIYADVYQIERVLENLISNAVKYTPEHGNVLISVKADQQASVIIQDSGVGISANDLPHIFEQFYRCNPKEQAAGTGLGLAIVKALVETHKGTIDVTSKFGEGSTFTINLPYVNSEMPVSHEVFS